MSKVRNFELVLNAFRATLICVLAGQVLGCGGSQGMVLKPEPMPEGGDFTGVWHSPQYGDMHMIQDGASVRARYELDERTGKIHGEAEGDLLRFEWVETRAMVANRPTETRGHGYFRYIVDPANGEHVIKGEWWLGDDETKKGPWNAYKMRNREPDLGESEGGETPAETELEVADDDLF